MKRRLTFPESFARFWALEGKVLQTHTLGMGISRDLAERIYLRGYEAGVKGAPVFQPKKKTRK